MALQKATNTKQGVSCNYWKILKKQTDRLGAKTVVEIGLYHTKDTADAKASPFLAQTVSFDDTSDNGMTTAECYEALKLVTNDNEETPYFKDAEDV